MQYNINSHVSTAGGRRAFATASSSEIAAWYQKFLFVVEFSSSAHNSHCFLVHFLILGRVNGIASHGMACCGTALRMQEQKQKKRFPPQPPRPPARPPARQPKPMLLKKQSWAPWNWENWETNLLSTFSRKISLDYLDRHCAAQVAGGFCPKPSCLTLWRWMCGFHFILNHSLELSPD